MADLINKKDSLNTGREKINKSIQDAEEANNISSNAESTANQALDNSESTQTQLDTIVIEGDSSVEAAQARVDADGANYDTLKDRLDTEHTQVTSQLADIAINVGEFGVIGDNVTINNTSLKSAIESEKPNDLLFPGGTYLIDGSGVSAMIKGNRKWIAKENVVFKYVGDENPVTIDIELNGYDFEIEGNLTVDANNTARDGLKIQNSLTMDNAVDLVLKNVKGINAYSTTYGQSSSGIEIIGAFNNIELDKCCASNISRQQGVGVPGSQGTKGISVSHSGNTSYPRNVIIRAPLIDTVTNNELYNDELDVDCDGISVLAPLNNGEVMGDTISIIKGGQYKNCKGRSIKTQTALTFIDDPIFIRDNERSIRNGMEVDVQYGRGSINEFECIYDEIDGNTPYGGSFKVFNIGNGGHSSGGVYFDIGKGVIINNVSPNMTIPYLIALNSDSTTPFYNLNITGLKHIGQGRVNRVLRGSLSNVENINMENCYFSWIGFSLINSTVNANIPINLKSVVHGNSVEEIEIYEGGGFPLISTQYLYGFNESLLNLKSTRGEYSTEGVRLSKLTAKNAESGGSFAIESLYLADGETGTFSERGVGQTALYFISSSFNDRVTGVFSCSGDRVRTVGLTDPTLISFGDNGINPDVANNLNVWAVGGIIHFKNNLGSARYFTLASIG